jgi:hypothetical protein
LLRRRETSANAWKPRIAPSKLAILSKPLTLRARPEFLAAKIALERNMNYASFRADQPKEFAECRAIDLAKPKSQIKSLGACALHCAGSRLLAANVDGT